ncbi:phosphoesterase family [Stylonychia lemnae]|uniref:Phosphoesterase family n=1 Tax=Stylonychia lemnae TaxID=5949 RepID=A0A078AMU7_STYLE|nr:phosphoesterase family [Stylonychia lemnae]|eukprot:CDW83246.1 phosphoesterase family [Stylonychia lemnae]
MQNTRQNFNASKGFDEFSAGGPLSKNGAQGQSPFNQTHGSMAQTTQQNTANIKGKLGSLDEMIRQLADELNYHKKEVQVLRSEKESLESVLTMKTQDVRKTLTNELFKVEEEMKRHYAHQKAENARIQQQVTALKGEKTALDMQLLELERRMAELELQVGHDQHH